MQKKKNFYKKICYITGKIASVGGKIIHKGISKKSGGIGLQLVKKNKRIFKPNLQKIKIKMSNGSTKRVWVSAKAIKSFKVTKVTH